MIRSGHSVRFTPKEVEEYRKVGLDVNGVKSAGALESEIAQWANTLAEKRPALLEKIAVAMTKQKGMKLPPTLI